MTVQADKWLVFLDELSNRGAANRAGINLAHSSHRPQIGIKDRRVVQAAPVGEMRAD